ncbi:hypothetical protein THAOC_03049, partial [Thalassiosira oceanica]
EESGAPSGGIGRRVARPWPQTWRRSTLSPVRPSRGRRGCPTRPPGLDLVACRVPPSWEDALDLGDSPVTQSPVSVFLSPGGQGLPTPLPELRTASAPAERSALNALAVDSRRPPPVRRRPSSSSPAAVPPLLLSPERDGAVSAKWPLSMPSSTQVARARSEGAVNPPGQSVTAAATGRSCPSWDAASRADLQGRRELSNGTPPDPGRDTFKMAGKFRKEKVRSPETDNFVVATTKQGCAGLEPTCMRSSDINPIRFESRVGWGGSKDTMQHSDNERARSQPSATLDVLGNDLLVRCASYLDADGLAQLGRTSARLPTLAEKLRSQRTAKWGEGSVHSCSYDCDDGRCRSTDWGNENCSSDWQGCEGLPGSGTIGMLMDVVVRRTGAMKTVPLTGKGVRDCLEVAQLGCC